MARRGGLPSLAGPYALDALDGGAEKDRLGGPRTRCQNGTSEVRGFRETATRLGMAAARQPPPEMRDRVMAAMARTRQVPAGDDHPPAAPPRPRAAPPYPPAMARRAPALGARAVPPSAPPPTPPPPH